MVDMKPAVRHWSARVFDAFLFSDMYTRKVCAFLQGKAYLFCISAEDRVRADFDP